MRSRRWSRASPGTDASAAAQVELQLVDARGTVDRDDLTRHEPRCGRAEEERGVRDVAAVAEQTDRIVRAALLAAGYRFREPPHSLRRTDGAGRDRVHPHAVRAPFHRARAREGVDTRLGRGNMRL